MYPQLSAADVDIVIQCDIAICLLIVCDDKLPSEERALGKALSNEKRADIVRHMEAGQSKENIAECLFITDKTVERVWKRYQETGSYEALPHAGGRKPLMTEEKMGQVVLKVEEVPDMTLLELIEAFNLPFTESALCRRLMKRGLTFKKRHSTQMGENEKM